MRISVGPADRVTVVATVHAESSSLADAVRLERVGGEAAATLRVRYPYGKVSTFRYEEPGNRSSWSGFGPSNLHDYDGQRVRVNRGRGTVLFADLEIQVPEGDLRAGFRTLFGRIDAEGLKGRLQFEVESADLRLRRLDGEIVLDSSSGDVRAAEIRGSWTSTSSSGDCHLDGFDGESFAFRAHSGDLVARDVKARRILTETTSGDVSLASADVARFEAEATSGDVTLTVEGARLESIRVATSSGDVSLGLPAEGAFDARAEQSSGDMVVGFAEGTAVIDDETLVGYRHGTGGAKIRVTTSSGDLWIAPR